MSFRAVREGVGVFASKARSGLTPLRSVFWWAGLRGIRAPLAEETLRRISFRAVREGVGVFASKARYGPTPLRSVLVGGAPRHQASAR